MLDAKFVGVLVGLLFGVVWVWQGAGDAFVVLLFVAIGWLVGAIVWLVGRVSGGEINLGALRDLISAVLSGRTSH